MSNIMNIKFKLFIIYILYIDSMLGLIITNNELTYLLTLLNAIIIPIVILTTNSIILIEYIFLLGIIIMISFSTLNILIWYISFELVLIPMIYLISKGSASIYSRYRALIRFTLYTILGGILLLISILIMIIYSGSYMYYNYILIDTFNISLQLILFPISLIPYLLKLPIIPFHLWLPDTHGEAPTSGSIYLAAILLKLGGIGIFRWLIPIFPYGYLYYRPLILILGLISSIYASITTLRHIDLKKLIAYSSIAHMGLLLIALSSNLYNISNKGFIMLLFSHGLVSSLLFLLIGILYVRTKTRYLYYFRGLTTSMPLFSTSLFIALLLNSAIPPSLSFFAELHIIQGAFLNEIIGTIHSLIALLFSGFYSILLFTRIAFEKIYNNHYKDITYREFILIIPLIIFSFIFSFILFC